MQAAHHARRRRSVGDLPVTTRAAEIPASGGRLLSRQGAIRAAVLDGGTDAVGEHLARFFRMKSRSVRLLAAAVLLAGAAIASCDEKPPIDPTDCTAVTLTPSTFSFTATGGTGSIGVGIDAGCDWTAQSQAPWITVTTGASGSGPGNVGVVVAEHTAEAGRTGSLIVAGQTVTVTQAGRPPTPECTFAIAPETATFNKDGGPGSIAVTAADGCAWSAASDEPWLTIVSGASGSGNGVVSYTVGQNRDPVIRNAVLTVADRSAAVMHEPDLGACVYSVAPWEMDTCLFATELSTTITTEDVCPWTATPNVAWITVLGESGVGSGPVRFRVTANYDAPRDGIVMVRWDTPTEGQNVRVAQAGCDYAVTQSAFVVGAPGATLTFEVKQVAIPNSCGGPQQDQCLWSAASEVDWITINTPMPQRGDQSVSFTVAQNQTHSSRTGTIRVMNRIVEVSQGR
jgi:hypothetical protein